MSTRSWKTFSIIIAILFVGVSFALGLLWQSSVSELKDTKLKLQEAIRQTTDLNMQLLTEQFKLTEANKELSSAQDELGHISDELETTIASLSEIQALYPLKDFTTYDELSRWASLNLIQYDWNNTREEIKVAAKLAENAMEDGYYVWFDTDTDSYTQTYCKAFLNKEEYAWILHPGHYDGIHPLGIYK